MSTGNTFGEAFRITTFGESHGPAIGVIVDGVPPRIPFDLEFVQQEMARRRPGQSKLVTQRQEADQVEVLSGVFEGQTTGAPLAMIIWNQDARSKDYGNLSELFRPGHADYPYWAKWGIRDYRGGGRSSGRETAARVAAGAVAAMALKHHGIDVWAHTVQVADILATKVDRDFIEQNPVRTADADVAESMIAAVEAARKDLDSLGAVVEVRAEGVPAGLGAPAFDKLDADIAKAMMGIGTVKGVEIGDGFASVTRRASQNNDPYATDSAGKVVTTTNHAGGIVGGISNGMPIVVRCALKPASSIAQTQKTVTKEGESIEFQVKGRHDPLIAPRFVPVAEAMLRIVLLDHLIRQKGLDATAPPRD